MENRSQVSTVDFNDRVVIAIVLLQIVRNEILVSFPVYVSEDGQSTDDQKEVGFETPKI